MATKKNIDSSPNNVCLGKSVIKEPITGLTILGEVINDFPEVAPILAQAGLHCIGCQVSSYESIQDGCKAHGMSDKDISNLIKKANDRVNQYNKMPKVFFTQKAILELNKRLGVGKKKKRFVRVIQNFGEFDFDAVNKKEKSELLLDIGSNKSKINLLLYPRIERMLRGLRIDFDEKQKDFVASRV